MTRPHPIPLMPTEAKPKARSRGLRLLRDLVAWAALAILLMRYAPDWFRTVSRTEVLSFLALLMGFIWLHVLIHELGHAIAGHLAGMEALSIGVLGWRWDHDGRAWRRRRGDAVAGISGYALMAPRSAAELNRARVAFFVLGGPAANILLATPALAFWLGGNGSGLALLAAKACAIVGLGFGLVNLLPFRSGGFRTDGGTLLDLLRDPQGMAIGFTALHVLRASRAGIRARDWSRELLPPWSEYRDLQTEAIVCAAVNCLLRALDENDAEVADQCAQRVAARFDGICGAPRSGIALAMAMHAVLREQPLECIRAWRAQIGPHLLDLSAYLAWIDAEIAFREGRFDEARLLIQHAREALPRLIDAGARIALQDYLDALAERLAGKGEGTAEALPLASSAS